jgi:hypothetical protein
MKIQALEADLKNFGYALNKEHNKNLGIYSESHVNMLLQKAYYSFEVQTKEHERSDL